MFKTRLLSGIVLVAAALVLIITGRIVGVRSTEQSVGIKVGGFCPRHHSIGDCFMV